MTRKRGITTDLAPGAVVGAARELLRVLVRHQGAMVEGTPVGLGERGINPKGATKWGYAVVVGGLRERVKAAPVERLAHLALIEGRGGHGGGGKPWIRFRVTRAGMDRMDEIEEQESREGAPRAPHTQAHGRNTHDDERRAGQRAGHHDGADRAAG